MKTCKLLLLALCCGCVSASAAGKAGSEAPRIVNIVNFIRNIEPRSEEITETVLYETVARQAAQLAEYGLPATFLLQYDALINPRYRKLLTQDVYPGTEVGGWWEITQPHVEAAGLKWRGRYPWDWHADVGFATGYTPEERRKLVDVYMEKFKEVFGKYPTAIGSWFIDAYTLGYMYDKYGIVASCNCKDQIGTDGYTLWGGYWNQAYYPSRVNAYMPAQTREGQIPVPVFRMLGSDPIYQYDNCVGGALQGVISLEPVYGDSGGSRRFVCVEVTAPIDTNVTINYRQLYAQAMQAIRSGERYWFNDKDEAVLKENNREFEQISPIEQLFHCHFRLPQEGEEGEWMSPIQILEILHAKNGTTKLTEGYAKYFGRILKKNDIEGKHTNKGVVYRIVKL